MSNHLQQYNTKLQNLAKRQKIVTDSFLKNKEQIIAQTATLTQSMLENLSQQAQLTNANTELSNFAKPKQLGTNKKPALKNKQNFIFKIMELLQIDSKYVL